MHVVLFASRPLFQLGFNLPIMAVVALTAESLERFLMTCKSTRISHAEMQRLSVVIVDVILTVFIASLIAVPIMAIPPDSTIPKKKSWLFWFLLMPCEPSYLGPEIKVDVHAYLKSA